MRTIGLTRGLVALVDDDDYDELTKTSWYAAKHKFGYYAARGQRINGRTCGILMHRQILRTPAGLWTDHINGDKLDNRRANLRIATPANNIHNTPPRGTSGYRGVSFHPHTGKWRARLKVAGITTSLGLFDSAEAAARAFDAAAPEIYGEFAWLNFPDERTERLSIA
jgi:hypothetical protein